MHTPTSTRCLRAVLTVAIGILAANATAAPRPLVAPTPQRQGAEARHAAELEALRAGITRALPKITAGNRADFLAARDAEQAAVAALEAAQQALGAVASAQGLVNHAKGKWIGGAEQGIRKAKAMLQQATTQAERDAARAELARWEENLRAGRAALEERQAALDAAQREAPQLTQALETARQSLEQASARTAKATRDLGLDRLLASDALDARLTKYVVLLEATPGGLAAFARQGRAQAKLIDQLLADEDLLQQMVLADGANGGNYGEAMQIYTEIQRQSPQAKAGTLQRLALAIALEHAVPIKQRNPAAATGAPATVDPVQRYLHYERAFLAGELDAGFDSLTTWDLRMVVDGDEPDETLAWGREMLRNYRPDHVHTADRRWRYVAAVRTEIRYGSDENRHDQDELQFFQNILMNGGVCGRRAFFGRFILRAFGVPTTARPQRGHAALVHWTPDGWVPCLGGGWGSGWTKTRYGKDLDFLATTQARALGDAYLQVKRAQWIGDVAGEKRTFGALAGDAGFWYGVALQYQRAMIVMARTETLAAVGEELAEANESSVQYATEAATVTDADRAIVVDADGVIEIPAVACSRPTRSTGKIVFMPSNRGGKQLHYSRNGGDQDFEYTFDAPTAGTYALTAQVVTPSWKQHLLASANGGEPVDIALPFTVGMWDTTAPVQVELVAGKNVLRLSRQGAPREVAEKGVTIRSFTLKPMP